MGRYAQLASNTVIFAIGSFSSKILVFLLMPLYTRVLTTEDYGIAEVITSTSNLLLPFVMVSINEAIVRFGMEQGNSKRQVFSVGVSTVLIGTVVFALVSPVLTLFDFDVGSILLIGSYVLAAALKAICSQFVRAMGWIRLFAFNGLFTTANTIILNIVLLVFLDMGATGYVLSVVLANVLSILFLFVTARLWRFIRFKGISSELRMAMYRYSIPLIPTTMFWWIVNVSDRFIIAYFSGDSANGVYSVAYKIPAMLTLVSGVFYQAWQISAIKEYDSPSAVKFYSRVLSYYISLLFVMASGIIMIARPITGLLGEGFTEAWVYVPVLVIAEVFSTLVTFLATFYMVVKKNSTVGVALLVGSIINIALNLVLVPMIGPMGAGISTLVSFAVAFFVRLFDVRRFIKLKVPIVRLLVCSVLLAVQSAFLVFDSEGVAYVQVLCVAVMLLVNFRPVAIMAIKIIEKFIPSSQPVANVETAEDEIEE